MELSINTSTRKSELLPGSKICPGIIITMFVIFGLVNLNVITPQFTSAAVSGYYGTTITPFVGTTSGNTTTGNTTSTAPVTNLPTTCPPGMVLSSTGQCVQTSVNLQPLPPISSSAGQTLPSWIKNNAKWWAEGQIGQDEFLKGIQYLIQNKIINPNPQPLGLNQLQSFTLSSDCYIKIDGINGEYNAADLSAAIKVLSFYWDPIQSDGGHASSMHQMYFVHTTDKTSPQISSAVANGQHFNNAQLECRKAGGEQQPYLTYIMNNVIILSSSQIGVRIIPVEKVGLNFASDQTLIDTYGLSTRNQIKPQPFSSPASASQSSSGHPNIPSWIKNNAQWWSQGQIEDTEFLKGIQYLVQNNIISGVANSGISGVVSDHPSTGTATGGILVGPSASPRSEAALASIDCSQRGPKVVLYQCDLHGMDLHGIDFQGADLDHANLASVNLSGANLQGADLSYAELDFANLQGANIAGTNFQGARLDSADLHGMNLSNSNLRDTELDWTNLKGANLQNAELTGAWLQYSQLDGASFAGAHLQNSNFYGANPSGLDFHGADLSNAYLEYVYLIGTNFQGANLGGADLTQADLLVSTLDNSVLDGATMSHAVLVDASLQGASIDKTNLSNADLNGANLNGANLHEAELYASVLYNAQIQNSNLNNADLYAADLEGASLSHSDLSNTDLIANLSGADLSYTNLNYAQLGVHNAQQATISNTNFHGATNCNTIFGWQGQSIDCS